MRQRTIPGHSQYFVQQQKAIKILFLASPVHVCQGSLYLCKSYSSELSHPLTCIALSFADFCPQNICENIFPHIVFQTLPPASCRYSSWILFIFKKCDGAFKMDTAFFMPSSEMHFEAFITVFKRKTHSQRQHNKTLVLLELGGGALGRGGQLVIYDSSRIAWKRSASAPLPPHPQTPHRSVLGWW